jgi:hypothetical protein
LGVLACAVMLSLANWVRLLLCHRVLRDLKQIGSCLRVVESQVQIKVDEVAAFDGYDRIG